jgi:hypothetical protein
MPAKQRWVNRLNSERLVTIIHEYYAFPKFGDIPDQRPIHQHFVEIDMAIKNADAFTLLDLLTYDLQCSAVHDSLPIDLNNNGKETPAKYLITTRPFIEGLLLLNTQNFCDLVQSIIDKNDITLMRAFVTSIQHTSLSAAQLFGWSTLQRNQLTRKIKDIKAYGDYLNTHGIAKGNTVIMLSQALARQSNFWEVCPYQDKTSKPLHYDVDQGYQNDFKRLIRKLKFCQLLHSQDVILNEHRDVIDVIGDVVLGVCSAGILNIVNYMLTGNFLFFNKTSSQVRIDAADEVVRPYQLNI